MGYEWLWRFRKGRVMAISIYPQTRSNQCFEEPFFADFDDCSPLQMVLIPAGTFLMGSPPDEPEREAREGPQHEVTVSCFFMGRYPITQAQWRQVAQLPPINRELPLHPARFSDRPNSPRHPVERIIWGDAVEWCDRLAHHTKRAYRLPTEAEWEYACRARTTTPFFCGETLSTDIANYNGDLTYGRGVPGKNRNETTPVDTFKIANPWGLCDMHGNVYEWCQDEFHNSYEGAPSDGSAWINRDDNADHICRGGSWYNHPRLCRSAYRNHYPEERSSMMGLRLAMSLET